MLDDNIDAQTDVFSCQAFYMDKQYRRALTLLKGSDLIEQDVRFRYLAAKCLVECQEWEECLMMVGGWEEDSLDSIDMQVNCLAPDYRGNCNYSCHDSTYCCQACFCA